MVDYKRIKVEYSDGVLGSAPKSKPDAPPQHGNFDYYRSLSETEIKWAKWMKTLGSFLKAETALKNDKHEYALADLPTNYTLLEHNKSQGEGRKPRTDMYLYGHPSGSRFRSTNEFMPHLAWLAKDKQHLPKTCKCKLCQIGGGGSTAHSGTRTRKPKQPYTGMSDMGKSQMQKASDEADKDLASYSPIYRVGEVVVTDGHEYVVADSIGECDPDDLKDALAHHTYTLLALDSPHERREQVPHAKILPLLAKVNAATISTAEILKTASPIAKFSLQPTATQSTGLPGPCYVSWFLGPEKIYRNDLVRLSPVTSTGSQDILLISHLILEVETNIIKVRGDIFELTVAPVESEAPELREIPPILLEIAQALYKSVRYVNTPGQEFDIVLADVLGRYYHPLAVSEPLAANKVSKIEKGRVTSLPPDLVSAINHVFDEADEKDTLTIGDRTPFVEREPAKSSKKPAEIVASMTNVTILPTKEPESVVNHEIELETIENNENVEDVPLIFAEMPLTPESSQSELLETHGTEEMATGSIVPVTVLDTMATSRKRFADFNDESEQEVAHKKIAIEEQITPILVTAVEIEDGIESATGVQDVSDVPLNVQPPVVEENVSNI